MSECESTISYIQRALNSVFRKCSAEDRKVEPAQSTKAPPLAPRPPVLDTPAWLEINAMNKMVRESGDHLEVQKRVHLKSQNIWTSR